MSAAALEASDAGTPEGELCPNCGGDGWYAGGDVKEPEQIQCEACQGTGKNEPPAPLAESGAAAPEERDGELDWMDDPILNHLQRIENLVRAFMTNEITAAMLLEGKQWIANDLNAAVAQRERAAREAGRAATGEVVGTGRVYRDLHSSMHVVPEQWQIPQDAVHPVHGIPVRVVRREEEEG